MAKKQERPLTPRQAGFIRYYTSPGDTLYNAGKAAKAAGYRGNYNTLHVVGFENLRKPKIQKEIRKIMQGHLATNDLTVDKVLSDLEFQRIYALSLGKVGDANKASELHGKFLKLFADRVEHVHSIEDATLDDLVALQNRLAEKLDGLLLNASLGGSGGDGPVESTDLDTPGDRTTH